MLPLDQVFDGDDDVSKLAVSALEKYAKFSRSFVLMVPILFKAFALGQIKYLSFEYHIFLLLTDEMYLVIEWP